jgi:hypothetical protein
VSYDERGKSLTIQSFGGLVKCSVINQIKLGQPLNDTISFKFVEEDVEVCC